MPNIEIYGFKSGDEIITKIAQVIPPKLKEEVVITFVRSSVINMEGSPSPFLRVWDTEERPELEQALTSLRVDIEYPSLLRKFSPVVE